MLLSSAKWFFDTLWLQIKEFMSLRPVRFISSFFLSRDKISWGSQSLPHRKYVFFLANTCVILYIWKTYTKTYACIVHSLAATPTSPKLKYLLSTFCFNHFFNNIMMLTCVEWVMCMIPWKKNPVVYLFYYNVAYKCNILTIFFRRKFIFTPVRNIPRTHFVVVVVNLSLTFLPYMQIWI